MGTPSEADPLLLAPPTPDASREDAADLPAGVADGLAQAGDVLPEAGDVEEASRPGPPPAILPVIDVEALDWHAVAEAARSGFEPERLERASGSLEQVLQHAEGPGLLFDADRADVHDRAIHVSAAQDAPLWIIGDLHGDLLALEAALALIAMESGAEAREPRMIFLGDLFDDEGFGLGVLCRIFELIATAPARICLIAGNHDEALAFEAGRFTSSVDPSDFADFLNAHLQNESVARIARLAIALFQEAPRALFLPDGLLVAHGGFPLGDLHAHLKESRDWTDPRCLADFVWTRAHPRARRKLPNRYSRGSQFGSDDFADFCALSTELGRPVTHLVRGHDHLDDRFAVYGAGDLHPVLTLNTLCRRLPRESLGPLARVPAIARYVPGACPQVYRLHVPAFLVDEFYGAQVAIARPTNQESEP